MYTIIGDIITYPEIKKWSLINLFTNEETLVTWQQLEDAFGDELPKIRSGRSPAWLLTEV